MKIVITINDFKVEITDTSDNAIKYSFEEIKNLITAITADYKKLEL